MGNRQTRAYGRLEAVNLELLFLGDADARQILANIVTLVSLQLNDLTIFWVFDDGAVASKLLYKRNRWPLASRQAMRRGRAALTFLKARTIFFLSNSSRMPWTVVRVFRPFLCWILTWIRLPPKLTSVMLSLSASPPAASPNGSSQFNEFTGHVLGGEKEEPAQLTSWSQVQDLGLVGH